MVEIIWPEQKGSLCEDKGDFSFLSEAKTVIFRFLSEAKTVIGPMCNGFSHWAFLQQKVVCSGRLEERR